MSESLLPTLEEEMQTYMDTFSMAYDMFGLTINIKKTEVMFQPAPREQYYDPVINIKHQCLLPADNCAYLGSILSKSANIESEVKNRISKARAAFGRLRVTVWEQKGISVVHNANHAAVQQ
uniref:Reverse transcriptase domain-containing protein n=1 Tax=Arion vulgaris TaxID=1028688 RepID=A0A0B7B5R6_9EUPU